MVPAALSQAACEPQGGAGPLLAVLQELHAQVRLREGAQAPEVADRGEALWKRDVLAEAAQELPLQAVPRGRGVGGELLHDARGAGDDAELGHEGQQVEGLVVAVVTDTGVDQLRDLEDVEDGGVVRQQRLVRRPILLNART